MDIKRKSRNPRVFQALFNILHFAVCIVIVAGSIFAIWDTERYAYLFPVVFLAAAVLNLVNGLVRFSQGGDRRKQRMQAVVLFLVAAALFLLFVISAVTVRGM